MTWHVVPGTQPVFGRGTEKVFAYTIEVENGIDTTAFGGDEAFARMVDQTLRNPKGWTHTRRSGSCGSTRPAASNPTSGSR